MIESQSTSHTESTSARRAETPAGVAGYWFKLLVQPLVAVLFLLGLIFVFGLMQRHLDWFSDNATVTAESDVDDDSIYACSMLCVFVKAPGRCPVCGMELQKIKSTGDPKDIYGVTIDPAARRLANIETVVALNLPVSTEIEALGRITYDETTEATVSAYVGGRLEDLLVNFTGASIRKGDSLAVIYSPDLYADQVALLESRKALDEASSGSERIRQTNQMLYDGAKRRLLELGVPVSHLETIESRGRPDRRIQIVSPMTGTVVKKLVEEGDYVQTGTPMYKIADLSTVWLMLEMFPGDTAQLQLGQSVEVTLQSLAGKSFQGRIAFLDPIVDPETQTVDVRVAIPNDAGLIRIGDFGRARIQTTNPTDQQQVVVPRESVLINGDNSIAYVETEPGRFEFRKVKIANIMGDRIAVASGIEAGEMVVSSGAFMLDSTFNIQGKVSLIDPERAIPKDEAQLAKDDAEKQAILEALSKLSPVDRRLAEEQMICPVAEVKLGAPGMGVPIRVSTPRGDAMICCEGCREMLMKDPDKYFEILENYQHDQTRVGQLPSNSQSGHDREDVQSKDSGDNHDQARDQDVPRTEAPK